MAEYFRHLTDRTRGQGLGPSPDKVSWTELCHRMSLANPSAAKEVSASPIFMSSNFLHLLDKLGRNTRGISKEILAVLRPEDALHIPQLRVNATGTIVDWNRSMCDITGISPAQVVGRAYADVLDEFIPNLSDEYKQATLDWLTTNEGKTSQYDEEGCREDYLFPLPLPLKYDTSFEYVCDKGKHYDEYIELLVARTDKLVQLYPKYETHRGVPQIAAKYFDPTGWFGGVEFTLRRKQFVPTLQSLCRELLPKEDHALNDDGSLVKLQAGANSAGGDPIALASFNIPAEDEDVYRPAEDEDVYRIISNYIQTCGPTGIRYIREVLNAVRSVTRSLRATNKVISFSNDWSSNPETSSIHKHVLVALGGADSVTQQVDKGKMTWIRAHTGRMKEADKAKKYKLQQERGYKKYKIQSLWEKFIIYIVPVISENKYAQSTCGASDSTFILPKTENSLLTLKIDGHERSESYYDDEKFEASATVQVPATLNFFQLHRVVCQTMNCMAVGTRETHEWLVPNIATERERTVTDEHCDFVQIGETYFIESGKREDYGCDDNILFDRGAAVRQRVSRTGVYVDRRVPLFEEVDRWSGRSSENKSVGKIHACIHSTCINSVFFQPGMTVMLQNGPVKYSTTYKTYKITCTKTEEYSGPLPLNQNINVMQPRCLRGKPEDDDDDWSVAKANKQLEHDRGCLRRNLFLVGSKDYLTQMPWCKNNKYRVENKPLGSEHADIPFPLAVQSTGIDNRPMFLHGEPPLPSSEEYEKYVSTLRGRIDPAFLQDHIMGTSGTFAVPFEYGSPGRGMREFYNYDSDDSRGGDRSQGVGQRWTCEVDEETARISQLQGKREKKKGRKRKAPCNQT